MEKVEEVTPYEKAVEELVEAVHEHGEVLEERQKILDNIEETMDKIDKDQDEITKDIERREQELFQKEVAHELKINGLEAFVDVINVNTSEELQDVVQKLSGIVNDIKIGAGYVPKENAKQAEYEVAKQNKDVKSMVGSKLANFFNK